MTYHITLSLNFSKCCYIYSQLSIYLIFSFQVAIKSIRKSKIDNEQDLVRIRREIENMSSLCHPHIIGIYEGKNLTLMDLIHFLQDCELFCSGPSCCWWPWS